MNFNQFRIAVVSTFMLFALVVSLQGVAQASASPETTTCKAMLPKCFPVGSPMWEKLMFDKMPKPPEVFSTEEEISSSAKKPICTGSGCPPSNVKEDSKNHREILPDNGDVERLEADV